MNNSDSFQFLQMFPTMSFTDVFKEESNLGPRIIFKCHVT